MRKQRFRKATITICSQPDGDGRGTTVYRVDHGTFAKKRVKINLVGDPGHDNLAPTHQNTVCHEMLHALSGVNDGWSRDGSCVRGTLDAPGPWDVAFLEQAYQRHGGKRGHK